MSYKDMTLETDVLVVGGGMSGIFAAIKAREAGAEVTLVDKNYVGRSGATVWSNIYTAFNPAWGHDRSVWEGFYALQAEGMHNSEWTGILLDEAYDRYIDLESWGVFFPKLNDGKNIPCGLPGVPIEGFVMQKGLYFLPTLRKRAMELGVRIVDHVMVTDLIKQNGCIAGAVGFHSQDGCFYTFGAKAVVTCTGPMGFKRANHMAVANLTGDAEAMAYRAGAEMSGKEFAFGGTAGFTDELDEQNRIEINDMIINDACERNTVWSGYLPQIGAYDWFVDALGYPLNRNNAAVAIHQGRGPILVNIDAVPEPMKDWSDLDLQTSGNQLRLERMSVANMRAGLWSGTFRPEMNVGSAHGGGSGIARAHSNCATSLPGLYAAGDCLNSRAVGAKYPHVGNGQANAAVTGTRAGHAAAAYAASSGCVVLDSAAVSVLKDICYRPIERKGGFSPRWVIQQLQNTVFPYYNCIVKHEDRLQAALTTVVFLKDHLGTRLHAADAHELRLAHETRNMTLNAEMIIRASLFRRESRGNHYREDYPFRDDKEWLAWIRIREKDGMMLLSKEPIPENLLPDLSVPYNKRYNKKFFGEYDQDDQS